MSLLNELDNVPKLLGNYQFLEHIGRGGMALVWKGIHIPSKLIVAIKIIPKSHLETSKKEMRFRREVELMKQMDHPLIVQLYQTLEDENNHYLIMEYLPNGNLDDYIKSRGPLPESMIGRLFSQIYSVLFYLHKTVKVSHRDLKAENILFDQNYNIRVIDFGLSTTFVDENTEFFTRCGSQCMYFLILSYSSQYYFNIDLCEGYHMNRC